MKKIATDLHKFYKQPLDANGREIFEDEYGNWTYDDGTPVTGNSPVRKRETRPVMTVKDLKMASPIHGKVIDLPKYQKIIKQLQDAVHSSKSGIVNFVIGREGEIVDAIMKAAFPPGSGTVYQGVDGYGVNCATWGNIDSSRDKLQTMLKGQAAPWDKDDVAAMRNIAKEIPDLALLYGVRPENGAPSSDDGQAVGPPIGGRAPAQQRQDPNAAANSQLDMTLDAIERLNKSLEVVRSEMSQIDRYSSQPKKSVDINGVAQEDKIAQNRKYEILQESEVRYVEQIRQLQAILPSFRNWTGQPTKYDGTGFMDFKHPGNSINLQLTKLYKPTELTEEAMKDNTFQNMSKDAIGRRVYHHVKDRIRQQLINMRRYAPESISGPMDRLIEFLGQNMEQIIPSLGLLKKLQQEFSASLRKQHSVMILNNVSDSALITQQMGGVTSSSGSSGGGRVFNANDVITDQFISRDGRQTRSIVMVSRSPIHFDFGGVETVNLEQFGVDEEEGTVLANHFISMYRTKAQKSGRNVSDVRVSRSDIKKIALAIENMSQADAIQVLNKAFNPTGDKDTTIIDGEQLWKSATDIANDLARESAAGSGRGGVKRACYRKQPKKTMDTFIRDKRTDWGTHVNKVNNKIDTMKEKIARMEALRDQEWELGVNGKRQERISVQRQIQKLEDEITAEMQGVKHLQILFGSAGCGKSVYPEAFADKMGYQFLDADLSQARGGLVGETESWTKALLDSWLKMSNVVIRMDEMDGQVVSSSEEARESYNASAVKQLLTFFQDNQAELIRRNVFVFGTTNHPERIRSQLMNRAELHYVPDPRTPEGYNDYLDKFSDIAQSEHNCGFIWDPDSDQPSNLWPETKALLATITPHLPEISKAFVPTGINFRRVNDFIIKMFDAHMRYIESVRKKKIREEDPNKFKREFPNSWKKGEEGQPDILNPVQITGFPFTAENFIKALKKSYPTDLRGQRIPLEARNKGEEGDCYFGIDELERELSPVFNKTMANARPEEANQMSLDFGEMSSGSTRTQGDLLRPADEDVLASTDYYFDALMKAGVLSDNKITSAGRLGKDYVPKRGRDSNRDVGESGYYDFGPVALVPVPGAPTLWKKYQAELRKKRQMQEQAAQALKNEGEQGQL